MRFKELTDKQKEKIISDYLFGKSGYYISNSYGISLYNTYLCLSRMNVVMRGPRDRNKKYTVYKNVFDEITPSSAYWIGFLMADGCNDGKGRIRVCLNSKDLSHLYKFKEFLGYSGNINKPYKDSRYLNSIHYELSISSLELSRKLISYGVTPHKSHICKVIGLEDNRDFWRGVMDGDGSMFILTPSNRPHFYPVISMNGSRNLMKQYELYIRKIVPFWKGNINKNKSIYRVSVFGKNALVLMSNLYKDATTYLDRKYELARKLTSGFTVE